MSLSHCKRLLLSFWSMCVGYLKIDLCNIIVLISWWGVWEASGFIIIRLNKVTANSGSWRAMGNQWHPEPTSGLRLVLQRLNQWPLSTSSRNRWLRFTSSKTTPLFNSHNLLSLSFQSPQWFAFESYLISENF